MNCRNIAAVLSDAFRGLGAQVIFDQSFILHIANLFLCILVVSRDLKTRRHTNGCPVWKKELMLIFGGIFGFCVGFYKIFSM